MALSSVTYIGDGVVRDYPLNLTLGYIDKSHIHVYLNGVSQSSGWSFTMGDSVVTFDTTPPPGTEILIRRITPNDQLVHDYSAGSQIIEENLDQSNLQALMLFHEALDGYASGTETEAFDVDSADKRYINKSGDAMEGPLTVEFPVLAEHAARNSQITDVLHTLYDSVDEEKTERMSEDSDLQTQISDILSYLTTALNEEETARSNADSNLQNQLTNAQPLEGSAFSPISWHSQVVNSVVIPDGVNAWSFGPSMEVAPGSVVEVGTGSFWTIADGEQQ